MTILKGNKQTAPVTWSGILNEHIHVIFTLWSIAQISNNIKCQQLMGLWHVTIRFVKYSVFIIILWCVLFGWYVILLYCCFCCWCCICFCCLNQLVGNVYVLAALSFIYLQLWAVMLGWNVNVLMLMLVLLWLMFVTM